MDIGNLVLSQLDVVSALLCFVLVWFMLKPYRFTGERRFLGLPLAFSFLGVSYILGVSLLVGSSDFINAVRWLQLFTQAYAFAFLAVTYYFSKRSKDNTRLGLVVSLVVVLLVVAISYLLIIVANAYNFPGFTTVEDYLSVFNIISLTYIVVHIFRKNLSRFDSKTIWVPFCFILFDFSQYSFLIWSIDASGVAFLGAHFLRFAGLIIFLVVAYQSFYLSGDEPKKGIE